MNTSESDTGIAWQVWHCLSFEADRSVKLLMDEDELCRSRRPGTWRGEDVDLARAEPKDGKSDCVLDLDTSVGAIKGGPNASVSSIVAASERR